LYYHAFLEIFYEKSLICTLYKCCECKHLT